MWADLAISAVKGVTGYMAASKQAASDEKWRVYNNTMARLGDSVNQNSLTTNENLVRERAAVQTYGLSRSGYSTRGKIEVAAAAAGVKGRSVSRALFDAGRNEAEAKGNILKDVEAQGMQIMQQRASSTFQAVMQQDFAAIPSPSPASFLLGFAGDAMTAYNNNR